MLFMVQVNMQGQWHCKLAPVKDTVCELNISPPIEIHYQFWVCKQFMDYEKTVQIL
jgi:hypothetical protein